MEIYRDDDQLLGPELETYKYICLMSESLLMEQLEECIKSSLLHRSRTF